uniref:Gustatory receptor n=1 Tax=Ditylenchus dipsaci TaxID=166011 RepID=A0A915E691_9BILA
MFLFGITGCWQRYYLHKGLLNSAVISCASEFYPVMLVAHWLACGRAEERADELIRRRQEKKSVRKMLFGVMGNVQQVYGIDKKPPMEMPVLHISTYIKPVLNVLAYLTVLVCILRWFVGFYFAIKFDYLHKVGSMTDDYMEFVSSCAQLVFFAMVYKWSLSVEEKRFDAHHKAEARGDLILIFGSAAFMSVKLLLQILELNFQRADGFIRVEECIIRMFSLTMIQMSEWIQLLCLRRIMALHFEDIHQTKGFLPSVALCSVLINWVCFGMTFFETNLIKYQLSKHDFGFSQPTLISMIFTQTIYPADYLFTFTAAGCWMDVLLRYMEMVSSSWANHVWSQMMRLVTTTITTTILRKSNVNRVWWMAAQMLPITRHS